LYVIPDTILLLVLLDDQVDAYFLRFHFLMPVIDKPSFLRQYKILMDNLPDVSLARTQTPFMALVFAIFACSAKLIDDPRLSAEGGQDEGGMGMVYYER
jgi:Fungal specific transcription factor domain